MQYIKMTKAAVLGVTIATTSIAGATPTEAHAFFFSKDSKSSKCRLFCKTGSSTSTSGGSTSTSSGGSKSSSTSTSTSGGSSTTSGGSTSTSGGISSTSGGSTTTSGGTNVPAPSGILLFGAGAAAALGGRKLAKKKAKQG